MVWFLDGDKEWTHQIIPKMKIFVDRKFGNAFFHEMKFLQKNQNRNTFLKKNMKIHFQPKIKTLVSL